MACAKLLNDRIIVFHVRQTLILRILDHELIYSSWDGILVSSLSALWIWHGIWWIFASFLTIICSNPPTSRLMYCTLIDKTQTRQFLEYIRFLISEYNNNICLFFRSVHQELFRNMFVFDSKFYPFAPVWVEDFSITFHNFLWWKYYFLGISVSEKSRRAISESRRARFHAMASSWLR